MLISFKFETSFYISGNKLENKLTEISIHNTIYFKKCFERFFKETFIDIPLFSNVQSKKACWCNTQVIPCYCLICRGKISLTKVCGLSSSADTQAIQ